MIYNIRISEHELHVLITALQTGSINQQVAAELIYYILEQQSTQDAKYNLDCITLAIENYKAILDSILLAEAEGLDSELASLLRDKIIERMNQMGIETVGSDK